MNHKSKQSRHSPKLRFPDFQHSGDWSNQLFESMYSFKKTNSFSRDMLNYKDGTVRNIHYGDIHTKFSTLFDLAKESVPYINNSVPLDKINPENYCAVGDIVFADASEDMEDIGKSIEIIDLRNEKILSGLHTLLARQRRNQLIVGFGGYLFKSEITRSQIKKEAQGAKVLGISIGRLSGIEVVFPRNKHEQKKIADCLASIDELISAQTEKLKALKAHKQGLMQQLFPAEGETVPRLRFPEFKHTKQWKRTKLGDISRFASGGTPSKNNPQYWGGKTPWISASSMNDIDLHRSNLNITDLAINSGSRIAKKGSLLILVRGSMLYKKVPMGIASIDVAFNQDVKSISLNKGISNWFVLFQLLTNEKNIAIDKTGIGAGKIDTAELKNLPILLPSILEQQKITQCLLNIHLLITKETDKNKALKAHKKGLMQQLFPSADGTQG